MFGLTLLVLRSSHRRVWTESYGIVRGKHLFCGMLRQIVRFSPSTSLVTVRVTCSPRHREVIVIFLPLLPIFRRITQTILFFLSPVLYHYFLVLKRLIYYAAVAPAAATTTAGKLICHSEIFCRSM